MTRHGIIAGLLLSALIGTAPNMSAQTISSPRARVSLVELFTSEGCSSCPPADQWFNSLATSPELWQRYVPVAYHVDYWDYIGWKDPFASPEHTQRQRAYARRWAQGSVYTPAVVLQGQPWRGWRHDQAFIAGRDDAPAGILQLTRDGQDVTVHYEPAAGESPATHATVALLGFDLRSRVTAGENRGRTLRHNFVVLTVQDVRLSLDGQVGSGTATLAPLATPLPERLALVGWVTRNGQPLQAAGAWVAPPPFGTSPTEAP